MRAVRATAQTSSQSYARSGEWPVSLPYSPVLAGAEDYFMAYADACVSGMGGLGGHRIATCSAVGHFQLCGFRPQQGLHAAKLGRQFRRESALTRNLPVPKSPIETLGRKKTSHYAPRSANVAGLRRKVQSWDSQSKHPPRPEPKCRDADELTACASMLPTGRAISQSVHQSPGREVAGRWSGELLVLVSGLVQCLHQLSAVAVPANLHGQIDDGIPEACAVKCAMVTGFDDIDAIVGNDLRQPVQSARMIG